jgi:2'-hydroxyisoflavone reductase
MIERRAFLKEGLALAVMVIAAKQTQSARAATGDKTKPLRILILGGTGFIGPYHVRYAVQRGHHVSVFNRGIRQADLPNEVEHLQGDRNGDLKSIIGRDWDAVLDLPTVVPEWVRSVGEALKGRVGHYTFISSTAVYGSSLDSDNVLEDAPLAKYEGQADPFTLTALGGIELYGPLKAVSEAEAERQFPHKTLIVRPGLIVGPGDDRFNYWLVRMQKGGEVLAPGAPLDPVQLIDVRDLAEFNIRMVEKRETGAYNATGPAMPLTWGEMLGAIRGRYATPMKLTWVPSDWLLQKKVMLNKDLPVWWPDPKLRGVNLTSVSKAVAKGMTFRSLDTTCNDVAAWQATRPVEQQTLRVGWPVEREQDMLKAWHTKA